MAEQTTLKSVNAAFWLVQGRLTLQTGVAVPVTDQTAKTTVFFTPYQGGNIVLFDGTIWNAVAFTEVSVAVPATTVTPFDIFAYNNAGTVTLETVNWTNDTTRATALTTQDGILVKTGDTTRRYLGTGRTTGSSGQCEDSLTKRFLWNYYNRVRRSLKVVEATATWTYQSATIRQANGSTANQVECVVGVDEIDIMLNLITSVGNSATDGGVSGIGIDSTTANNVDIIAPNGVVSVVQPNVANLNTYPAVGYHKYCWVEFCRTVTAPVTFYGTSTTVILSGMTGILWG